VATIIGVLGEDSERGSLNPKFMADKPIAQFSGGMRRRLDLAASLITPAAADLPGRADHGSGPAHPRADAASNPVIGSTFLIEPDKPQAQQGGQDEHLSGAGIPRSWLADALAGAATCS
jgi:hypothetical protein